MTARRVLYIQHAYALGGSAVSLLSLAQSVKRHGCEPVIACPANGPAVTEYYRKSGLTTMPVAVEMFSHTTAGWWPLTNPVGILGLITWLLRLPFVLAGIRSVIEKTYPDLVHLNSLTLAPYALFIRRLGLPVVLHVRESAHPGHFGIRRAFLRYAANKWCDETIYICEDNRRQLDGGTSGVVVYNSVDFESFDRRVDQRQARARLGLRQADNVALYVGGVSEIKGILPLMRALPEVAARSPDFVCLMPGAEFPSPANSPKRVARRLLAWLGWLPSAELQAKKLYEKQGMSAYVRLMKFCRDMPSLLAAADVLVFPSIRPHFARPVMEAAAMAKPVVASAIGGVEEIVEDGVTGRLAPPEDAGKLADAIVELLADKSLAKRMGEAAFELARQRFDASLNAERVAAIYERLLPGV